MKESVAAGTADCLGGGKGKAVGDVELLILTTL